jgi:hypothetical protein
MNLTRLNYGLAPGDGLGDILFDIFGDIDANFILLEGLGLTQGNVCAGTKYAPMRAGIKYMFFAPVVQFHLYYISDIKVGTVYDSGHIEYSVTIKKTASLSAAGDEFAYVRYIVANNAPKTGLEKLNLFPSVSIGGGNGTMVIDWDEFSQNGHYTCDNWLEGALITINTGNIVQGGGGAIDHLDISAIINGNSDLILLDPQDANMVITIDVMENIQGRMPLKNISDTYDVLIESAESLLIDGHSQIVLHAKANISIRANVDHFIVEEGLYELPA